MALVTRREVLNQAEREIALDIYCLGKANGSVDAVSYRADHEDSIDALDGMQSRQLLKRDSAVYRITFRLLIVLDGPSAKQDLVRCHKAFDILRAHYKDSKTRNKEKKISGLARELGCTFEEATETIRYLLDVSTEWYGGGSTELADPDTAFVLPSELILRNKTFDDLAQKVRAGYESDRSVNPHSSIFHPSSGDDDKMLRPTDSKDIFIVHGHDRDAKETVSRFVEKIGLNAVVLHEKPNAGRTIIEKFSDYADVAFAIVLLTPDDEGKPHASTEPPKARARQNVILELGYFLGKLGRNRVCALHVDGVEIPSDYQGVLFVPFDENGYWKTELMRELKAVGIAIDANRVFGL